MVNVECSMLNGPPAPTFIQHSTFNIEHSTLVFSNVGGTILAKFARIMPGKGVARRSNLDLHGIRRDGSKETGFTYRSADGAAMEDEKTIDRIRKLRIPPAWQDVRIARGDSAPLQAV